MLSPEASAKIINELSKDRVCYIMLIGVMGSGKTEYVDKFFPNYNVVNMGDVREELSEKSQVDNSMLYNVTVEEVKNRCIDILNKNESVIYDASNCYPKVRSSHLRSMESHCDLKIGIILNRSLVSCFNNLKHTYIPTYKIENMYLNLKKHAPNMIDGFDILINVDMEEEL